MGLVQRLWDRVFFIEETDIVRAEVTKRDDGGIHIFKEPLIVKDIKKVRMSRIFTELNDVCIPEIEDTTKGIRQAAIHYRRRVTYLFGMKFRDEPILEKVLDYEDGRQEFFHIEY